MSSVPVARRSSFRYSVRVTLAVVLSCLSLPATGVAASAPAAASVRTGPAVVVPASLQALPATTRQVIRATRTNRWCARIYCTQVTAWERNDSGAWVPVTISGRARAVRSQIGPAGFAPAGRKRQGDMRTPTGVYSIATTFSVGPNPGTKMPWRQRLRTTTVSNRSGRYYNTWIQERGRTDGTRPAMRYGLWVSYNNPRLRPGAGPAPVANAGSGIFFHVGRPGQETVPSEGCVQLVVAEDMRWLLRWLNPKANPRILLNR